MDIFLNNNRLPPLGPGSRGRGPDPQRVQRVHPCPDQVPGFTANGSARSVRHGADAGGSGCDALT